MREMRSEVEKLAVASARALPPNLQFLRRADERSRASLVPAGEEAVTSGGSRFISH